MVDFNNWFSILKASGHSIVCILFGANVLQLFLEAFIYTFHELFYQIPYTYESIIYNYYIWSLFDCILGVLLLILVGFAIQYKNAALISPYLIFLVAQFIMSIWFGCSFFFKTVKEFRSGISMNTTLFFGILIPIITIFYLLFVVFKFVAGCSMYRYLSGGNPQVTEVTVKF